VFLLENVLDISFGKCWVQNKLQINKNLAAYAVGQIHLFHNRTRAGTQILPLTTKWKQRAQGK